MVDTKLTSKIKWFVSHAISIRRVNTQLIIVPFHIKPNSFNLTKSVPWQIIIYKSDSDKFYVKLMVIFTGTKSLKGTRPCSPSSHPPIYLTCSHLSRKHPFGLNPSPRPEPHLSAAPSAFPQNFQSHKYCLALQQGPQLEGSRRLKARLRETKGPQVTCYPHHKLWGCQCNNNWGNNNWGFGAGGKQGSVLSEGLNLTRNPHST